MPRRDRAQQGDLIWAEIGEPGGPGWGGLTRHTRQELEVRRAFADGSVQVRLGRARTLRLKLGKYEILKRWAERVVDKIGEAGNGR